MSKVTIGYVNVRFCWQRGKGGKEQRKGRGEEEDLYTHTGMHATTISLQLRKKKKRLYEISCLVLSKLSTFKFHLPPLRVALSVFRG